MGMRGFLRGHSGLCLLACGATWLVDTSAEAQPPEVWTQPADGEDSHQRPDFYQDPNFEVPPSWAEAPDYPLAVAFVPADPSNYTSGGISSYDYVVVHTMQGYYGGSISWFQNPSANVSAHYVMRAEDGEVTQMVRNDDRAWHVGTSNPYAIGIEHEGFVDDPSWYTWNTYVSSAHLARWLCDTHGIPIDRDHVVGHVELPNQTHIDPGDYWAWDMYMALIGDVVSADRIEGVVVDASLSCTLTATVDTWLKRTLQGSDALGETEKCFVPAGTQIEYAHASGDMAGHHRLLLVGDHPCVGLPEVEQQAFAYAEHFEGFCAAETLAAAGVTVTLDGGAAVEVAADGSFSFEGVSVGAHAIDAAGEGFVATMAPVDIDGFPGARVIIPIDPEEIPGGTGGADAGESDGGGEASSGDDDASAGGEQSGSGGTTGEATGPNPALPDTFGQQEEDEGCACRTGPTRGTVLVLLLMLPVLRRRRSA